MGHPAVHKVKLEWLEEKKRKKKKQFSVIAYSSTCSRCVYSNRSFIIFPINGANERHESTSLGRKCRAGWFAQNQQSNFYTVISKSRKCKWAGWMFTGSIAALSWAHIFIFTSHKDTQAPLLQCDWIQTKVNKQSFCLFCWVFVFFLIIFTTVKLTNGK